MSDERTRKAAKEFRDAIAEEIITKEGITDISHKKSMHIDIQREIEDCRTKILNLPYANLEEQSAVLSMLSEHTYMQIRKFRDDSMNAEEISWLVNEMQDSIQKLSETIDRIIKHETRRKQND